MSNNSIILIELSVGLYYLLFKNIYEKLFTQNGLWENNG